MNSQWMLGTVGLIGACGSVAGIASAATLDVPTASVNLGQAAATAAISHDPPPPPELPSTNGMSDFWNSWKHNVEIGFNGAEGNSDNFSIRGGVGFKREATDMVTVAGINYKYAQQDDTKSQSRGEAFIKNDYIWQDTKWGFFWQGKLEYDEFQAWDWRASFFLGPSYTFVKNDRTLFRGRAGLGFAYEMGGTADEEVHPEAMLGFDWEHKINDRQKVFLTAEWYPSLDEFPEYRAYVKGGWEVLVDPDANMFLKLGFEDRYDHGAEDDRKKNDFEYYGMISWVF